MLYNSTVIVVEAISRGSDYEWILHFKNYKNVRIIFSYLFVQDGNPSDVLKEHGKV